MTSFQSQKFAMKKFAMKFALASFACAFSFVAQAKPQKMATMRIASHPRIVKQLQQFGKQTDNEVPAAFMSLPFAVKSSLLNFIQPREKCDWYEIYYALDDEKSRTDEKAPYKLANAMFYPISNRENFLAREAHEKVTDDGIFQFSRKETEDESSADALKKELGFDNNFFAFSKDGKWIVICSNRRVVEAARDEFAAMDAAGEMNELLNVNINETCFKVIFDNMSNEAQELSSAQRAELQNLKALKIKQLNVTLTLDKNGLSFAGALALASDSIYAQVGRHTLAKNPFSQLPSEAICALAAARDSGLGSYGVMADGLTKLFAKYHVKTDALTQKDQILFIDILKLFAYAKNEGKEQFAKIDPYQFMTEYRALAEGVSPCMTNKPFVSALAICDFAPSHTLEKRFAKIFSDQKNREFYAASVLSLESIANSICKPIDEKLHGQAAAMIASSLLENLPAGSTTGGIGIIQWREKDDFNFLLRVSPDEIKSLYQVFLSVTFLSAMQNMAEEAVEEDEEDYSDEAFQFEDEED